MQVSIFLADFANNDPSGKVNVIGAGWQVVTLGEAGATVPHSLVILISADPSINDTEFSTMLTLREASGVIVQIPAATGDSQDLQIAQTVKVSRPTLRDFPSEDRLWSQGKVVVNLPNGLPLKANHEYEWVFEIEGVGESRWGVPFFVVEPSQMRKPGEPTEANGSGATAAAGDVDNV